MFTKDIAVLLTEFLGSDALLGLGIIIIAGAVQLFNNGQIWESFAFLGLSFVVLFLRSMRKTVKQAKREKRLLTPTPDELDQ